MGSTNSFKNPLMLVALAVVLATIGLYSEYSASTNGFTMLGDFSTYKTAETDTNVDDSMVSSVSPSYPIQSSSASKSVESSETSPTTVASTYITPTATAPTPTQSSTPVTPAPSSVTPVPSTSNTPAPTPAVTPAPTQPTPVTTGSTWKPKLSSTFYIQLQGTLPTNVLADIYVVDLFDTATTKISELKQQGSHVVCYLSAGSAEDWRDDYSKFAAADKGKPLSGWAGESWVDTRSSNVRDIMSARIGLAASKGCNGVDVDNVDEYTNDSGFPLTAETQLDYNRFLANQAHARGLVISLKNDINQLDQLASSFDLAINEQCNIYNECSGYQAFTSLGKPVLNIEYANRYVNNTNGAFDALCAKSRAANIYTLILAHLLDGSYRKACN